uniref:Cytochrome c oxidase subunit 3 n=1 Tax=Macridiscus melanaegis TaxID=900990 RepID=A0A6C0RSU2_9BIVA|nr:cytochrome c oxidase subunit III [Macridiscus melanaegis]QIA44499.1 cytochrome c oxidase subunit III [Macridiscus melanaegis]QUA05887.1 cytochrome c oxidase subunit III [Macridiscus melanaegis]
MARTGYQLLARSPWPLEVAFGVLGITSSAVMFFHSEMSQVINYLLILSFLVLLHGVIRWWMDMVLESTYKGQYTSFVILNIRWGFKLFVLSEVFFFVSFFWAWFYAGIGEISVESMGEWPPVGLKAIYPWRIPFLNLVLLVTSGAFSQSSKWAVKSHSKEVDPSKSRYYQLCALVLLMVAMVLGLLFVYVQGQEYYSCSYSIADGVFGCSFFMLTGFHGMHVMAGLIFLLVCWFRILLYHFSYRHSCVGLLNAVYYWHFVDIVWIFLYALVYLWPHKLLTGAWLWTY